MEFRRLKERMAQQRGRAPGAESLTELRHFMGHTDALKAALTVAENLSFYASRRARVLVTK